MLKQKTRKGLIFAAIAACMAAVCSAVVIGIVGRRTVDVTADALSLNLFNTYNAEVAISDDEASEKSVLEFKPTEQSGLVAFTKDFVGKFSMDFSYTSPTPSTLKFSFIEDSGEAFDLRLRYTDGAFNASVSKNGESAGIYYSESGTTIGNTAAYNRNGEFTRLAATRDMKITFDASTMSVYIGNGLTTYKVWEFRNETCDGKAFYPLNAFEAYTVEFEFETYTQAPRLLVSSVNDAYIGSGKISNLAKPSVVGYTKYNSYAGKAFVLPAPLTSDLMGDDVQVRVSVTNAAGRVVLAETAYTEGLSIMPNNLTSAYDIKYTAKNSLGNQSSHVVNVLNYKDEASLDMQYNTAFELLEEGDVGVNAVLNIPVTTLSGKLFTTEDTVYALYDVKYEGETVVENAVASQNTTYKFEQIGSYTVEFKAPDSLISEKVEYGYNVVEGKASLECAPMATRVLTNATVEISDGFVVVDDERVEATSKIIFPSGKCYADTVLALTEMGVYEVVYEATVDGTAYSFSKEITALEGVQDAFTSDADTSFAFGTSNVTDLVSGVKVQTRNARTVRYNKIIDLTKLTRDDMLLELMADVSNIGSPDFTEFVVTLTDVYDSSNVLKISAIYSDTNSQGNGTYIKAGAPGQTMQGWYKGVDTSFGYDAIHSFIGKSSHGDVSENTLKLYFDYSTLALYSGDTWGAGIGAAQDYMVADFDDSYFYGTPWEGFTTGECYLDISAKGALKRDISYTIVSVAGNKLDKNYTHSDAVPVITLDMQSETGYPDGVKGLEYQLFSAKAVDNNGKSVEVTKKVYFRYGQSHQAEIEIVDNAFLPIYSGTYTVVYAATDAFNRTATSVHHINILSGMEDMDVVLSDFDLEVTIGKTSAVPVVERVENAVGAIQVERKLFSPNGSEVTIEKDAFLPKATGEYTLRITVTDYQNRSTTVEKTIAVVGSNLPVLNQEVVLPKNMISGNRYTLPQIMAQDYSVGGADLAPQIYVTDSQNENKLLPDGIYVPTMTGSDYVATVTYRYVGAQATYEFSASVQVIYARNAENQNRYDFSKYFVTQAEKSIRPDAIYFSGEGSKSVEFINELSADHFTVKFIGGKDAFGANDRISVLLTDAATTFQMVTVDFTYNGALKTMSASFNGGAKLDLSVEYANDGADMVFGIYYDKSTKAFYDHLKKFLTYAEYEKDKETVRGFLGNTLNVSFALSFQGKKEIGVSQINNQIFTSNTTRDRISPQIVVPTMEKNCDYGARIQVLPAQAYDVLSSMKALTVSVSFNGGYVAAVDGTLLHNVPADRTYEFDANGYGEYTIEYTAVDAAENSVTSKNLVILEEKIPPQITVNGSYEASYTLGSTISICGATVTDNVTANMTYSKYVVCPNGAFEVLGDSYTFTRSGRHTIRYFAMDELGNIAFTDFVIEIVKGE